MSRTTRAAHGPDTARRKQSLRSLHIGDLDVGGGAEVVFNATVRAAVELGHEVVKFTSDGRRGPTSYVYSMANERRLARLLTSFAPDVVHVHNYYHYLSPSVLHAIRSHKRKHPHVRVVYTAHDYHLACPNSGFQHFVRGRAVNYSPNGQGFSLWDRFDERSVLHSFLKLSQHVLAYRALGLHRVFDVVVSPSEIVATALRSSGLDLNIEVVRNPIDIAQSSDPTGNGLVFLGRLTREKGLAEFIQVLDRNGVDCSLDIYGTGDQYQALEKLARRTQHVSVTLHGPLEHSAVPNALRKYRALVYPSTWLENAPLSLLEAAIMGLGVVVPRFGGGEELADLTSVSFAYDASHEPSICAAVVGALSGTRRNHIMDANPFRFETYRDRIASIYGAATGIESRPQES